MLDQAFGARLAQGTVGIRLRITRFVCKIKMSQDKDEQSRAQIIDALRRPGRYRNPAVADGVECALNPEVALMGSVQGATEALFNYGTLQQADVQQADVQQHTFGRLLAGHGDVLVGHRLTYVEITDEVVVARSGSACHPIVVASGDRADSVRWHGPAAYSG